MFGQLKNFITKYNETYIQNRTWKQLFQFREAAVAPAIVQFR